MHVQVLNEIFYIIHYSCNLGKNQISFKEQLRRIKLSSPLIFWRKKFLLIHVKINVIYVKHFEIKIDI